MKSDPCGRGLSHEETTTSGVEFPVLVGVVVVKDDPKPTGLGVVDTPFMSLNDRLTPACAAAITAGIVQIPPLRLPVVRDHVASIIFMLRATLLPAMTLAGKTRSLDWTNLVSATAAPTNHRSADEHNSLRILIEHSLADMGRLFQYASPRPRW